MIAGRTLQSSPPIRVLATRAQSSASVVCRSLAQTDGAGAVNLHLRRQHSYLANAVVLRPLEDDPKAVWQTLWASITFALPE